MDHFGLVAGVVDELGLPELIDTVIKQDHEQRIVSLGTAVKAMIINGLGFVNRALYLMPHFFKDKPVERLLGKDIKAEHLDDDTLGRALDSIYEYGPEKLYGLLAAQSVNSLGLSCKVGHIDSTSFHVDGGGRLISSKSLCCQAPRVGGARLAGPLRLWYLCTNGICDKVKCR